MPLPQASTQKALYSAAMTVDVQQNTSTAAIRTVISRFIDLLRTIFIPSRLLSRSSDPPQSIRPGGLAAGPSSMHITPFSIVLLSSKRHVEFDPVSRAAERLA